ncbi:MAG: flagellar hook-length control protein FliK [Rhizobiales bacterium]|nr:flagellar hook-length control protein FliK [Hyphomicrobiales bacterium]
MPHVASALKNHGPNRPLAARPAPDRAPPASFASLFDDKAPAPERPPRSAAADKGGRAARSDQAQQPAKSTDSKTAKATDDVKSADAGKDAKTGKADKTDQAAGDGKMDADAKIADAKTPDKTGQPTDGKDAMPASDGKAADALVAADVATAPPSDPMPTITIAEATVTVLAPTTGTVPPAAAAADNAATVATPAEADALAALQAGTAKADNDAALTAKAAAQPHGEAKPQGPAGLAADKDAIAQARGEAPLGEHANTAYRATPAQANAALTADAMTAAPKAGTDAASPIALTAPLQTTAPAGPTTAASAPMPLPAAIPLAGVAIEIAGKALAGKNYFEIRLDPPELGRIEVRLDVDRDGNVTSRIIADRADTLDLLRRDVSGLERALQDAGLKTSDNGLQFSLRDQSAQQQQAGRASDIARLVVQDEALPANDTTPRSYSRLAGLGSGVDIHV